MPLADESSSTDPLANILHLWGTGATLITTIRSVYTITANSNFDIGNFNNNNNVTANFLPFQTEEHMESDI